MKHPLVFGFAFLMFSLVVADQVNAVEIHVPDDHATIQVGVDAEKPFDVVVVSPGIYNKRVVLKADITLKIAGSDEKGKLGLKRAETTVIDGGGGQGQRAHWDAEAEWVTGAFALCLLEAPDLCDGKTPSRL